MSQRILGLTFKVVDLRAVHNYGTILIFGDLLFRDIIVLGGIGFSHLGLNDSDLTRNSFRSERMISGDHHHLHTGSVAGLYGVIDSLSGWILKTDQANKSEAFTREVLILLSVDNSIFGSVFLLREAENALTLHCKKKVRIWFSRCGLANVRFQRLYGRRLDTSQ
jgi:hypothetical protein